MAFTVCVFAVSAAGMICAVLFKPYVKFGKVRLGLYWLIPFVGAIIALAFGALPFKTAIDGITANAGINPLKILALFFAVSLISLFLGNAGFFDYVAEKVFMKAGSGIKLFISLYLAVSLLTAFTSNDIVILTFTPPICIFCKKANVSPVPYLFGEFVAANTWSMALVIGNPTNVYLAGSVGISFFDYFSKMILPTVAAGAVSLLMLLLLFGKTLKKPSATGEDDCRQKSVELNGFLTLLSLFHLFTCLVLLAIADFIGLETYLACVIPAASLTLTFFAYCAAKERSLRRIVEVFKGAPYELIPFILSMFVLVLALAHNNITGKLSELLLIGKNTDGISFGFLSAFAANLFNNIPMSVLMEKIIGANSLAATYGAVIGSNIGAFITPVGALAGIMWSKILSGYGVKFSFAKFIKYGLAVALPTLAASTLTLLIAL